MSNLHIWMLGAFVVSLACSMIFFWQMLKAKAQVAANNKKGQNRRKGDLNKTTRAERKVLVQARHFLKIGNAVTAAKLFESVGYVREALAALESSGNVEEAARLLIKGRSYHRAAVLYARYGMWTKAKDSYRIANMPLEAGKAAREAGELENAISFFERAGRLDLAAETCEAMGNLHRAARLYATAGKREDAIRLYRQMSDSTAHQAGLNLEDGEIKIIVDYVTSGHHDKVFTDLLVKRNKLVEVILHLLTEARMEEASELYLRADADVGQSLVDGVSFSSQTAERLGEMFSRVSHHQLAGELFERMGSYERAAQCFERSDDLPRAASCHVKAGMGTRSIRMQIANEIGVNQDSLSEEPASAADANAASDLRRAGIARLMGPYEVSGPIGSEGLESEAELMPADAVMMDELRSIFYRLPLFEDLEFHQRSRLWNVSANLEFERGQTILDFGKEADGLYIVLKGTVACIRNEGGSDQQIDRIYPRDSFGELWLLTEMPTGVKFTALDHVTLRMIPRGRFLELMDKDGTLARKLYKRFTKSLLKRLLSSGNHKETKIAS